MKKISILIAAPNELVRDSLRAIMDADDSMIVVGEASSPAGLVEPLSSLAPDVVVVDHDSYMWMDMVDAVKSHMSATRLLLLSTFMDESDGCIPVDESMRVMAKGSTPALLYSAIHDVAVSASGPGNGHTARGAISSREQRPPEVVIDERLVLPATDQDSRVEGEDVGVEHRQSMLRRALSVCLHIGSLGALAAVFSPLAQWYYSTFPPIGFDFLHFVYYVNYIRNNPGFFTGMWKSTWYAGAPFSREYPFLNMYAAVPLANYLGDTVGSQLYQLLALFAFAIACYFLYYALSRHHLISLMLAAVTLWSPSVLNAAVRDGWASFSASQVFFVLSFLLLVKYFQSGNGKFAIAAAAVSGIAFGGHAAMGALTSMFSYGVLFFGLLFWPKARSTPRLRLLILYPVVTSSVGAAFAFPFLSSNYVAVGLQNRTTEQVTEAFPNAIAGLFASTHPLMFVPFAIFTLLAFHAWRGGKGFLLPRSSWPFAGLLLFLFALLYGYEIGRNPMQALGGPNRAWWIGTILFGCIIAALSAARRVSGDVSPLKKIGGSRAASGGLALLAVVIVAASPPLIFEDVKAMAMQTAPPTANVRQVLLNLGLDPNQQAILAADLPEGIDLQSIQHRVWIGDPSFALLWNMLFPMPNTKGYFYQALFPSWDYWREVAISGGLTKNEGMPEVLARNNALFHLDWYAVKYLYNVDQVAPYLLDGLRKRFKDGGLSFLEVSNPSKIVEPTNAQALMVVGDRNGYDVIMRAFAARNLNSQRFLLIRGPENVDDLDEAALSDMDGLILYNHSYRDRKKGFDLLKGFVDRGGNLMLETGSDSEDTQAEGLPDPFPISLVEKRLVEGQWGFEADGRPLGQKLDFAGFSPPSYEGNPWGISATPTDKLVKAWAKVVVKQEGKPVVVAGTLGKGRVLWGGLNLPYHLLSYRNPVEAEALASLVTWVFDKTPLRVSDVDIERQRPERIAVSGQGFQGVLVREYGYSGWSASVAGGDRTASRKIYSAGPDLMYVRVPAEWTGRADVVLSFGGPPRDWAAVGLSVFAFVLVFEYLLFSGRLLIRPCARTAGVIFGSAFRLLARRFNREEDEDY